MRKSRGSELDFERTHILTLDGQCRICLWEVNSSSVSSPKGSSSSALGRTTNDPCTCLLFMNGGSGNPGAIITSFSVSLSLRYAP